MTRNQPVRQRRAPGLRPDRSFTRIVGATPEQEAIEAGVRAGDDALTRFGSFGALVLFADYRRFEDWSPRLESLRAYAELKRALLRQGHDIPGLSLAAMGYTAAEIAHFDAAIAATSPSIEPRSGTSIHPARMEND